MAVPGFMILALAVFVINYGKVYAEWDEFSHWGRFLEECCRLNQLYVMSPAGMAHKDYVPAVTLFEYLWCKLSLAYSEANAYRGIQMLLVAIALHLAEKANFSENRAKKLLQYVFTVFVFMGIPVFFAAWPFYHSIYEDAIFGILLFYASWVAIEGRNYGKYHSWIVLVSLSVLILSKMTAAPFVFLIWLLYLAAENCNGRKFKEHCPEQLLTLVIPAALWFVYNLFARHYVHVGGTQSYSGFTPELILGVLTHNGVVAWQSDVERSYWKAIFTRGIIGEAPYAFVVIVVFAVLILLTRYQRSSQDSSDRLALQKNKLLITWLFLSTAAYTLMMCVLYDTSFSEYEARQLASFERYMSSWAIVLLYWLMTYILTTKWKIDYVWQLSFFVFLSFITVVGKRETVLSGILHPEQEVTQYEGETKLIDSYVSETESVLVIERGANGDISTKLGYYCIPRKVDFCSPGPEAFEGDVWSTDMSLQELRDLIQKYDYVYVVRADGDFVRKYRELFPEVSEQIEGELYRVNHQNQGLVQELVPVNDAEH